MPMWNGWRMGRRSKWAAGKLEIWEIWKGISYSLDKAKKLAFLRRKRINGEIGAEKESMKYYGSGSVCCCHNFFFFLPSALYMHMWNWMLPSTYLASKSWDSVLLFVCISRVQMYFVLIWDILLCNLFVKPVSSDFELNPFLMVVMLHLRTHPTPSTGVCTSHTWRKTPHNFLC